MQDPIGIGECEPRERIEYYALALSLAAPRGDIEEIKQLKGELDRAYKAAAA